MDLQVLLHFCPEDKVAKAQGLERLKQMQHQEARRRSAHVSPAV